MSRERHGALTAGIPSLFFMAWLLAGPVLLEPARGAHFDNTVSNLGAICYDCHTLNGNLADNNTSFINASSRTLPTMRSLSGGVSPGNYSPGAQKFGCTYCHNDPTRTTNMKTAIGPFDSRPSQHPIDRVYAKDAYANVTLTANTYTTLYLSNWDNTWTRPANQLGCIDCHDAAGGGGSYPNHPIPGTGTRAAGVNPFMLKNTPAMDNGGHAPDAFCLGTCHAGTAPGTSAYSMGHFGWGAYRSTTGGMPDNTLKEHDGTPLKTSKCVDCHETHSTTSKPNLMGEQRQSNLNVDPTNCTSACHYGAPADNAPFTTKGHGRPGINLLCANCHDASVSHRDTVNPRRLIGTMDPTWATLAQNLASNGLDDDFDGQVDNPTENAVRYSAESTCSATCHSDKHLHSGSITTASGPVTGSASCLHCHDPHAKGTGANIAMVRNKVMGNPVTYQTSKVDFYRSDNTSVCDNPGCHAKRLGNNTTPGTILYDISDHRLANIGVGSDCSGCHNHSSTTGASSFSRNCNSCHTYPGQAVAPGSHVLSSVHDRHVNPDSLGGYAFSCATCHYLNTHNQSGVTGPSDWGTKFAAGNVNIRFDNTWNPRNGNGPKYAGIPASSTDNAAPGVGGTGSCDGLYCHGNSSDAVLWSGNAATGPRWDNSVSAGCGTCHRAVASNPPTTFAHAKHADNTAGYAISCGTCHYATTQDGRTILSRSEHLNRQSRVSFDSTNPLVASGAYGGTLTVGDSGTDNNAKCSNIYCHSPGYRTTAPFDNGALGTPAWNQGPLACNACHGAAGQAGIATGMPAYPNGTPKINSHARHISSGYGCQACHSSTTSTGNTITNRGNHVNAAYNTAADNAAHGFAYASPNCTNIACHAGSAAVWGGGSLKCGVCHLGTGDSDLYQSASNTWYAADNVASIDGTEWLYSGHGKDSSLRYDVSNNPGAGLPAGAGTGDPCLYCHDATVGHQQPGNPFRLDNQAGVPGYSTAGWNATCLVCHSKTQIPPGYGSVLGYANLVAAANDRVDTAHYGTKHATDNTGGGHFCWDCHDPHGDRANSTTGNIYMIQKVAMARSDGAFGYRGTAGAITGPVTFRADNAIVSGGDWANAGGTGLCQVCHSGGGTGSPTQAKYYTPTSFANHNQDKVCTTCHDHNKEFAASCNACHGEAAGPGASGAPPYAPFGGNAWASRSVIDNLSVLPGIGDHRTAAGVAYSSHETLGCGECHTTTPGSDNAHNTGKTNATMATLATHNWDGATPATWSKGTYDANPAGGTASVVDDSCANINCHSPYYGGNGFKSGTTAPYVRYWMNATLWDCYSCHPYDGRTATSRPAGPDNTMSTGMHTTHVKNNQMSCSRCHNVSGYSASSFGANHKNGLVNWSFAGSPNPFSSTPAYSVADNTAAPTDDNASAGHRTFGTCSSLYCHSIAQTAAGGPLTGAAGQYKAPAWDNALTGKCGTCHGGDGVTENPGNYIASGSHTRHVTPQYSYACSVCHSGLGRGAATHADNMVDLNVGATFNGTPIGATYSKTNRHAAGTGFGSCTASYCHGTDNTVRTLTGGANQAAGPNLPTWGDNTTNRCGACHGAPGGSSNYPGKASDYPTSGAHVRHMAEARGPVIASCTDCHVSETMPTHADGKVDFRVSKDNTAATTLALTQTCDPCHGTGVAAAKGNWATVADVDCLTCHQGTVPAYSYANATGRIAPNELGDNTTYGAVVRGHNRPAASGPYPVSNNPAANRACASCHDVASPHIDNAAGATYGQLRLLTGTVNGVVVDNTIQGLCAACHTNAASGTAVTNKVNTHGNAGYPGNLENKASSNPPSPGPFTTTCNQCHEPHGMVGTAAGPNIWMINPTIRINGAATATNVAFTSRTGANSFNNTRGTGPLSGYGAVNELCVVCHAATNAPYSPMTYNVAGWHNAPAYTGDETGKDCSGCHSHNQDASNATVDGLMPLACNGCHSYPGISGGTWTKAMSSSHRNHVGDNTGVANSRGYQCTLCHFAYNHNQNNVLPGGAWPANYFTLVDIRFDNALNPPNANGPSYNAVGASSATAPGNGGTGACAGVFCHGNASTQSTWGGTTTATPPKWDNTVPAGCGTCHGASSALSQGNHPAHLSAVYGPGLAAFSSGGTCSEGTGCHTAYGLTPTSTHVDGLVGLRASTTDNTQAGLAATQVCRNCHSAYASSAGTGDNLVRTRSNWDNTAYTVPCITCHNNSAGQQGTQNMDGGGHAAPNIEAAWATLGGHGDPSIDNAQTTTDNGAVDQVPPVRCETCHDELGQHIGTAKDTVNPYRLDNTLTNFVQAGGLDRYCTLQCHSTTAQPPRHAWIVNGTWAAAKDNTVNTHPSTMQVVPQPGAPPAETVNKAMWYQIPADPLMPVAADVTTKSPPTRSNGSLLVCVTCHDPHGVGTSATATRTFSGSNTMAAGTKKMLRYNASGAVPTPLCAKCHR